jgi:hypothetical protein
MTIHYKIKKADSHEYWTGYSSAFSKNGVSYHSLEDAGAAIAAQLKNSKTGIAVWAQTAQVIAFKVEVNAVCSYQLTSTIELSRHYDKMRKDHGVSFIYAFKLLCKRFPKPDFKYAVQIHQSNYKEFRETMKGLGFSSRAYKKIGDWIFFSDDDFCVRVKLVDAHDKLVNSQPLFEEYLKQTVSAPASNDLLTDAVFDDDAQIEEDEDGTA